MKTEDGVYASYLGPMGYLASRPPEPPEEDGDVPSVVNLTPWYDDDARHWDARGVRIQALGLDFAVESLRLVPSAPFQAEDALDELEKLLLELQNAESAQRQRALERKARREAALQASSLRDQTVLDAIQDDIFRRPINDHILLLGPPGTGKSTVHTRRTPSRTGDWHWLE